MARINSKLTTDRIKLNGELYDLRNMHKQKEQKIMHLDPISVNANSLVNGRNSRGSD